MCTGKRVVEPTASRTQIRTNVEVFPAPSFTTSSVGLRLSIVLVVVLFNTRSSSALLMFNVTDFPLMAHVPRIVPVTPWPRVLLMNPRGRTCDTNLPSAPNDIVSLVSSTAPRQSPTIFAGYSASLTGAAAGEHDENPQANRAATRKKRAIFIVLPNGRRAVGEAFP